MQDFQLVGGPDWINSDRFDIEAKPEGGGPMSPQVLQSVLRQILEDRFALKVHRETRELPIYALVVARSDGRLGPNLKPSSEECSTLHDRARPRSCADGRGGPAPDARGGFAVGRGGPPTRRPRRAAAGPVVLRRRTSMRLQCAVSAAAASGACVPVESDDGAIRRR